MIAAKMQSEPRAIPASMRALIVRVHDEFAAHPKIAAMFDRCFRNTFETTLRPQPDGSVFVITGDIPAMWLRDSTAQVKPYLLLAREDEQISDLLAGVVRRQLEGVILDPYANAFNEGPTGHGHQTDLTAMSPWVWERKYEVDSLCAPLQLSYWLWRTTGRTDHLTERFSKAARLILETWRTEQNHALSPYSFQRLECAGTDTLSHAGRGAPVGLTGMTWSGFRPSDDGCELGYLIPANMLAVVSLRYLEEIAAQVLYDENLRLEALVLRGEIEAGIERYGRVMHPEFGEVYAYEVDGLGGSRIMDDANVPSLLSAPQIGYCEVDDPMYQRTRKMLLSPANPFYFAGSAARGIGSPHTPGRNLWPISLCIQGMTSSDSAERMELLETLTRTDAGTGFMHESFDVDDPSIFTREWFAWANSLFAEFVLDTMGMRVGR
jgi:uncharacterized protein